MFSFKNMNSHELNKGDFESLFDIDHRLINERKFRQHIFKGGISDELRHDAWLYLFQFYPFNSTPRERKTLKMELEVDYQIMRERCRQLIGLLDTQESQKISFIPSLPFNTVINIKCDDNSVDVNCMKIQSILKISRLEIQIEDFKNDLRQIDKDIPRTGYLIELEKDNSIEISKLSQSLRDILIVFSAFNQKTADNHLLGYTQGMNELASIFLSVFKEEESIAYWCFSNFMLSNLYLTSNITLSKNELNQSYVFKTNTAFYFTRSGLLYKSKQLCNLLKLIDKEFYDKFEELKVENLPFCHEWLLINFKRLFTQTTGIYLKCFEKLASHFIELETASLCLTKKKIIDKDSLYTFDLFICLALLNQMRNSIMNHDECTEIEIFDIILMKNKTLFLNNFDKTFEIAEELFKNYLKIEHDIELV